MFVICARFIFSDDPCLKVVFCLKKETAATELIFLHKEPFHRTNFETTLVFNKLFGKEISSTTDFCPIDQRSFFFGKKFHPIFNNSSYRVAAPNLVVVKLRTNIFSWQPTNKVWIFLLLYYGRTKNFSIVFLRGRDILISTAGDRRFTILIHYGLLERMYFYEESKQYPCRQYYFWKKYSQSGTINTYISPWYTFTDRILRITSYLKVMIAINTLQG